MLEIEVPCPTCAATGESTHEDRHAGTDKDVCRTCGGRRTIPARPGESRETSWPWAVPEAAQARLAEEAGRARPAGTVSILEERVKAGVRYFRDGAAVRTGVLPDHASHIADVLQSLLSEPVPPRAAEPASDATVQARRLAADLAEERFRGDLAALFMGGVGDDHPWVQMALRGLRGRAPTVRDRQRESDGWCAWPPSTSHALRLTLYVGGKSAAELEAFSMNGPWYAIAKTPQGECKRLVAGPSLHAAVAWCEKTVGYRTPIAAHASEQGAASDVR